MNSALDEMFKGLALMIPALDDEDRVKAQDIRFSPFLTFASKLTSLLLVLGTAVNGIKAKSNPLPTKAKNQR